MNYVEGPSPRAQITARRTYNRPLDAEGTVFETWEQTIDRVIGHQRWLWERALGETLNEEQEQELSDLKTLMVDRKVSVSGRTLWLGGTDIAKRREASQFNCSFLRVETVSDIADGFWLLLQGCGVGFEPIPGTLNGFAKPLEIEIVPSTRTGKGGHEHNKETIKKGVWTIKVGDSAAAWSKVPAKILANKNSAHKLVIDFSEVRPAGERLAGYGWISSGYEGFAKALTAICAILNRKSGQILNRIDILDIMNWLGTTLSSRRSAEICVVPWGDPEAEAFARAKKDYFPDNVQRGQSNNSLLFYERPTKYELAYVFNMMEKSGGSEPGFINAAAAYKRAPWFKGCNPCAEILLGNKSFCNLVEVCLPKFNGQGLQLLEAIRLAARANYRQTCVDLRDEILQTSWHELNQFLRLCGIGMTGIVSWEFDGNAQSIRQLRKAAHEGADSMADELGLPRSKAKTTIKPSGTLSKVMDCAEGIHKPNGRYIINNMNFSKHDPIIPLLKAAGYRVWENPVDDMNVLVSFPVAYENIEFETVNGVPVNLEPAVSQLERYKMWMDNYVDHNCSITISYDSSEVEAIIEWLMENWSHYVGVSFIYRNDPTKTAEDLGYKYLPQEVVTEEIYSAYASTLLPVDLEKANSFDEIIADECATGACPIK
jgi:adenosylcobalamin-dependent ribonucleoside-triphosphate reductase